MKSKKVNESAIKKIDDNYKDSTVMISTETPKELSKVSKEDKQSFEDFKQLYKDVIDIKYRQDYGETREDKDLWEDCAKELYLKQSNYILKGDEYKSKEVIDQSIKEKKTESRKNDVKERITAIKNFKKELSSLKPNTENVEELIEDLVDKILEFCEDIKDTNFAGEDLYNQVSEVLNDPDAEERGLSTYIRSVKTNLRNILDDFIDNYNQAFEEENLNESVDNKKTTINDLNQNKAKKDENNLYKEKLGNHTFIDKDEAEYYRNKELYAYSNLAKHREAMEKAKEACKAKGIEVDETRGVYESKKLNENNDAELGKGRYKVNLEVLNQDDDVQIDKALEYTFTQGRLQLAKINDITKISDSNSYYSESKLQESESIDPKKLISTLEEINFDVVAGATIDAIKYGVINTKGAEYIYKKCIDWTPSMRKSSNKKTVKKESEIQPKVDKEKIYKMFSYVKEEVLDDLINQGLSALEIAKELDDMYDYSQLKESKKVEATSENAIEFVELVNKLKQLDLWDGKDETFKEAVRKYYEIQDIDKQLKSESKLQEEFYNLYNSFDRLYKISKYNPTELKEFLNDLKRLNRIADSDFDILTSYANKWQNLINETGHESNLEENKLQEARKLDKWGREIYTEDEINKKYGPSMLKKLKTALPDYDWKYKIEDDELKIYDYGENFDFSYLDDNYEKANNIVQSIFKNKNVYIEAEIACIGVICGISVQDEYELNESNPIENLSDEDKWKILGIDKIISLIQTKYNIKCIGSYTNDNIKLELEGDFNSMFDAMEYIQKSLKNRAWVRTDKVNDNKFIVLITKD